MKFEVPATVGVPLILPELRDNPVGSEPDRIDQVYGAVPPVAVSEVVEYAVPAWPPGREVVVICNGAGAAVMTMLKAREAVRPLESCTCTVKFEVPATVGVPLMLPALRDNPVGSEPDRIDQV